MVCMFREQVLLVVGEGAIDSGMERIGRGVAALGHTVMLDRAEDTLDGVELGAVRWQVVQRDAARRQVWQGILHDARMMDAGVVEHDDRRLARDHRGRAQLLQQADQMFTPPGAGVADPMQRRSRPIDRDSGKDVQPPTLRTFVGDAFALTASHPTVGHRLGGAEATLIQVQQAPVAGRRLFF